MQFVGEDHLLQSSFQFNSSFHCNSLVFSDLDVSTQTSEASRQNYSHLIAYKLVIFINFFAKDENFLNFCKRGNFFCVYRCGKFSTIAFRAFMYIFYAWIMLLLLLWCTLFHFSYFVVVFIVVFIFVRPLNKSFN